MTHTSRSSEFAKPQEGQRRGIPGFENRETWGTRQLLVTMGLAQGHEDTNDSLTRRTRLSKSWTIVWEATENMKYCLLLLSIVLSSRFVFPENAGRTPSILRAPTYYIAVSAHLLDENTIAIRGASNLPPGSKIAVQAGDGTRALTDRACVAVREDGFFQGNLHPVQGVRLKFSPNLAMGASFRTTECGQPASVLQIVGKNGQYLGNDNYDNKIDIHMEMTPGMINNPQLFQESGWYFGLSTSARVSQ